MVHRMVELGLLDRTEAYTLVPNIATPPSTDGESLMVSNRSRYIVSADGLIRTGWDTRQKGT